jgi:hypothetical protein
MKPIQPINLEFEFTYDQYLGMSLKDREKIYYALYAFFNNEALALEVSQREVFDYVMAKTIREEAFEFSTILRDFDNYFESDF